MLKTNRAIVLSKLKTDKGQPITVHRNNKSSSENESQSRNWGCHHVIEPLFGVNKSKALLFLLQKTAKIYERDPQAEWKGQKRYSFEIL